jgi:hypothetical protein
VPSLILLPTCSVRFQCSFPGERAICFLFGPVSATGVHLVLGVPGAAVEARPSVLAGQFLFSCFAGVTNQNSICRCDSAVAIL